ncbi:MAG TPA: outer membrane beta-barrel protein [Rhizobiaceae bacterium]|nr:outer membrane beta-barrel protein [Rhizobiaceae bacterium]
MPAIAQDTMALRGSVTETDINNDLLRSPLAGHRSPLAPRQPPQQQSAGIPSPQYEPRSEGAVADDGGSSGREESLFPDAQPDDAFADEPAPLPTRPPTTARGRAEQLRAEPIDQPTTPELDPESTIEIDDTPPGTVRVDTIDRAVDLRLDPGAGRAQAIERIARQDGEAPYAPLGLRLGTFTVRPSLETGLTGTSNADFSPVPESAVLSETTLRLNAISDWSRHSASFNAFGTLRESVSGAELDEKSAGFDGALELDLGYDYRALASLGYVIAPESASSPATIVETVGRPIRQTLLGSLGLEKDLGRLRFAVTGRAERDWYGDAELPTGGTISQQDRDSTLGTLVLRGGYELSPALTPFAEVEVGRRDYQLETDSNGFQRSTNRLGARAGVAVDINEKLEGEISAGWIEERFDDPRLVPVSGPTIDADLAWSPIRGTIVGLSAATTVESATAVDESGSLLYAARLDVQREMRANLTGNIAFGAAYRDYAGIGGHDLTLGAEAGLTYWLNRYVGLTTRARHERQTSTIPGRGYEANSIFLGMRLQR